MPRAATALVLPALLLTAGCLGALQQEALAPLPPEGTVFAALVWQCSWKPWTRVIAVYPDGTLYHLEYTEPPGFNGSASPPENLTIPRSEATRVLQNASRAAGFNASSLGEPGQWGNFTHGEPAVLSTEEMRRLRARVAAADLANRTGPYHETDIVDGCTFHHGAWQDGTHHAVESHGDVEPRALKALRAALFGLHPAGG